MFVPNYFIRLIKSKTRLEPSIEPSTFAYRWLFAPYVHALIRKYNVQKQSRILDLGCGTGLFSELFYEQEMKVISIDRSKIRVRTSRALRQGEIGFIVGDANQLPFKFESFDLIFCRGLNLYNLEEFGTQTELTRYFLKYLREKGLFIFAWGTDGTGLYGIRKRVIGKPGHDWLNLTLSSIEQHFSSIPSARLLDLYFLNRTELVFLGQYGLSSLFRSITSFLTKTTHIRGEAICVLEKQGVTDQLTRFRR
ncbi:MAG: class I SAM-dependent methyltransferase [Promethearchaeota archaeon]